LIPNQALIGEEIVIRYRALEGLQPLVDIFLVDDKGKELFIKKAQLLTESNDVAGLYEYTIELDPDAGFIAGKPFTVFIQEPTTGNVEAGSIFVDSTSLGDIQEQTALLLEVRENMNATAGMINRIEWIRRQLMFLKSCHGQM